MSSQSVGWPTMDCLTLQCMKGVSSLLKPSSDSISFRMKSTCLIMTLRQYHFQRWSLPLLHSAMMNFFMFFAEAKHAPTLGHLHLLLPLHGTLLPLIFIILARLKCHKLRKTFSNCLKQSTTPSHAQLHYPALLFS